MLFRRRTRHSRGARGHRGRGFFDFLVDLIGDLLD
jgi:hypothetical protein